MFDEEANIPIDEQKSGASRMRPPAGYPECSRRHARPGLAITPSVTGSRCLHYAVVPFLISGPFCDTESGECSREDEVRVPARARHAQILKNKLPSLRCLARPAACCDAQTYARGAARWPAETQETRSTGLPTPAVRPNAVLLDGANLRGSAVMAAR
ncbi:hypothetical protein OIDMADRAFT_145089 [Oidiodendron maius Zn]|uniref:Uncharacterized protein n=1 Tax=Oidiodendron maius (strain Zn) TaxID=913774 RepID=A0A0C3DG43_OIDMZ|nr:hypothetical protein OIDMADRAFT_145089 [Oidiodendron maius Zn]